MSTLSRLLCCIAACIAWSVSAPVLAQSSKEYTPQVGQEGKDVIWVPTPQAVVDRMLKMAEAKPGDYVMDLGSGDGVTVITAAKLGIRATGIEYNPDMVEHAKRNAQRAGVGSKAEFIRGDIFATDFSKATVITMYLLPYLNLKLRPIILNLKPGTRIVSHAFTMDDWVADRTETVENRTAYLWIVPAKIQGNWKMNGGGLVIKQVFQIFEGVFRADDGSTQRLTHVDLRGDRINFRIGEAAYTGQVSGPVMQGTMRAKPDAPATSWSASLIKDAAKQ